MHCTEVVLIRKSDEMGYYTHYELTVSHQPDDLAKRFDEIADYGDDFFEDLISGSAEACKWYEHDEVMKQISLEYPDILFTLKGNGEEDEDIWTNYYKNGRVQTERAEIKVAPFDESKLKEIGSDDDVWPEEIID